MPGFGFCTHLAMGRLPNKKSRKKNNSYINLREPFCSSTLLPLLLNKKRSVIISLSCLASGIVILITGGLCGAPLFIMISGSVLIGAAVQSSRYLLMIKEQDFTCYSQNEYIISLASGGVFGAVAPLIGLCNPGAYLVGEQIIPVLGQHLGAIVTYFCTISLTALIKTGAISCLFILITKIFSDQVDYIDTIEGFITGSIGSDVATYLSFITPPFADLIFAVLCSTTPHVPYIISLCSSNNYYNEEKNIPQNIINSQIDEHKLYLPVNSKQTTFYWNHYQKNSELTTVPKRKFIEKTTTTNIMAFDKFMLNPIRAAHIMPKI